MTRPALLDNQTHRALRVVTTRGAAWGDDQMQAVAFPTEFRNLQAHYPIVFQKTADGTSFQPVALLGLQDGQNLFLGPAGWDANHIPLAIERLPFLIGRQGGELVVHVDLDSPRLSTDTGEPLFDALGGATPLLERFNALLLALHEGVQATPPFVQALLQHDLLESFVLDVDDGLGGTHRLAGYHTIAEERLQALSGHALGELNAAGHLLPLYMAVASLSRFRDLIDRHQRANAAT